MNIIKKTPVPIAGLMLASASLGNLLGSYNTLFRHIFMAFAILICIMLIIKISVDRKSVLEKIKNPIVASVTPTFSMGLMIISTYLKLFNTNIAISVWYIAIALHICLILWFTYNHIIKFSLEKVFPSYFIVYAGIVVASVTAPVFNQIYIGSILFWVGFIPYMLILPVVIYRFYKFREIPEAAVPTMAIFTAPSSLCLAGYLSSIANKNSYMFLFLLALSLTTYFFVLFSLGRMLKIQFYPSFSGLTFPLVISAIAIKMSYAYSTKMNLGFSLLRYLYIFQLCIAVIMVLYVSYKYFRFITSE